jgi:membrane protease YdiL (CAAX protease family)
MLQSKITTPFKATVITLLLVGLLMLIPIKSILIKLQFPDFQAEYFSLFLKMGIIFFFSYYAIKRLKFKTISGISTKYKWKHQLLNLTPLYLCLLGIASIANKDFSEVILLDIIILFIGCMAVGFAEEFLFRGFLQSLFLNKYISKKRGLFIGVFLPALSFGLFHLINLLKSDFILPVFVQVIFATFIGFFFGVILLKTNKIIPLAITHALINFFFSIQFLPNLTPITKEETTTSIAPLLITLPLFIIGLFLLKKINKEEIKEKLNA